MSEAERTLAYNEALLNASGAVGVFGRSTESLRTLENMIAGYSDALAIADKWLLSDAPYLLCWLAKDGRSAALICAGDEYLLGEDLDTIMAHTGDPANTILMSLTGTEIDPVAEKAWSFRGGRTAHW